MPQSESTSSKKRPPRAKRNRGRDASHKEVSPSQTPPTGRVKRLAKKLVLLASTLLLLLIGAEIATRWLTDVIPPLTIKDPQIGQRYLPSFEAEVYVPEAGREILLRFNRAGFRGPDRPQQKPQARDGKICRRVAVLGDSMIASLAVDEEDTMVCRLERMLNESHGETTWEVLNFGVSGASPGQAMVLYRELASRYDPDVVLCAFFVGNDLADNCSRLSNNPRIYFDLDEQGGLCQLPFSAGRARIGYYLNRYSRFYVWQKHAVNKTRRQLMNRVGMIEPGQWICCNKETEKLAHAWKLTNEIHRAFQQEVESRGAEFAVVLIPSGWQIYEDVFQTILDRAGEMAEHFEADYPDRRLGALCRAAGIPLVSMSADFRRAAPSRSAQRKDEWLFHGGNGHFNRRGNEIAARVVHRFLTQGDPQQLADGPLVGRLR